MSMKTKYLKSNANEDSKRSSFFFNLNSSKNSKHKIINNISRLTMIFGISLVISFSSIHHVRAENNGMEDGDCLNILREVGRLIGAQGEEQNPYEYWNQENGELICAIYIEKKIDTRGDKMGEGYFYYENTFLQITNLTSELISSYGSTSVYREATTFHGYPALYTGGVDICNRAFDWFVPNDHMQFSIIRCNYEIPEGDTHSRDIAFDIRAMAEVFYTVAYNRMPDLDMTPPDEGTLQEFDAEQETDITAEQMDMTTQAGEEEGEESGIPESTYMGNLIMPITGAFLGSLAALVLSNASSLGSLFTSSAAVEGPPATTVPNHGEELYWSPRPWDEAGPGYVSKAEYEQTKNKLEQGYRWTKDGWQQPEQAKEFEQFAKSNQEAVAREDTEWKEAFEREQKTLENNATELKEKGKQLDAAFKLNELKIKMSELNHELEAKKIYVQNPYHTDLIPIRHGLTILNNMAWDRTAGRYNGDTGLRCEHYVDETISDIKKKVREIYGPDARVEAYKFDEKSSIAPRSGLNFGTAKDWCDSLYPDNHIFTRVTLPDGTELSVDFHQHNIDKRRSIVRPISEVRKHFKGIIGENEFHEGVTGI